LIISVGLPVIVRGDRVYRGRQVIVPPERGELEAAAQRGWVDLRAPNCATWVARARRMAQQEADRGARAPGSSSAGAWGAIGTADPIEPARFATWIFTYEDDGERIKR
jgi:hypothetical protein